MKWFIIFLITVFLTGCGGGGSTATDASIFQNKVLDLRDVKDLDKILYTFFLENSLQPKTSSISRTRGTPTTEYGDISGSCTIQEEYDPKLNAYVGEIVYDNYKNSAEGCDVRYIQFDIKMNYIRYSDKIIYYIEDDGILNNAFVKKGGQFTVKSLSNTKIQYSYNMIMKIDDIYYKFEDLKYTEEEIADYRYDNYISGKIFVITDLTNGYFYVKNSEKPFKLDKCGNCIDGTIDLTGENSLAQLKVGNKDYIILVDEQKNLYFNRQWNINKNSIYQQQKLVQKNADINISEAWARTYGEGVKIAVIDNCFDTDHEDLRNNILSSWDINTHSSYVKGDKCHGTMVAGVIGALNNQIGLTGVAPNSKLILIKIDLEHSSERDFINAFEYAKNSGAQVINCSWGSDRETQALSDELKAIKDAGIITVFASGNTGEDMDNYNVNDESEDPSVIGVGATAGETNDLADYSNYGSNIDILAPGGSLDLGVWLLNDYDDYAQEAGTSFASPTVAGVVALMLSQNPNLTFEDIYTKITQTADKVGLSNGANYVNGYDKYRAYGKINAGNALQ